MTDPRVASIFDELGAICTELLGETLVGVYIHGSLALGGFTWETGDIDALIVVEAEPPHTCKRALIKRFLSLEQHCPPKGLELSMVCRTHCQIFRYPTPYCLHYSATWRDAYCRDLDGTLARLQGTDKDLAAHFAVINQACITVCGADARTIFAPISAEHYRDSIHYDIANAAEDILENPVYVILNLCRAIAYVREQRILSKYDGALWALKNLPPQYGALIRRAADHYQNKRKFPANYEPTALTDFAVFCLRTFG